MQLNTLKNWCDARGVPVPDIESRAALYQAYGLGPKGSYIGTAEQNNRLLVELKKENGQG